MTCWKCLKFCVLPQRVVLCVMGFLGVVVSLAARAALSVAITEMIVPIDRTNQSNEYAICPADAPTSNSNSSDLYITHGKVERYNWTEEQQGWILSAFYAGHLIGHIPAGMLSDRFGGKLILSLSVLLTSIGNAVIPYALKYGELKVLILLRILMGLVGGATFPALIVLLAAWVPERERGKLGTLALSGSQVGNLVSFYISGLILSCQPWPVAFYFWAVVCMIWFIVFMLLCYKDPASHPFITKTELNYLKEKMGQLKRQTDLPPTPWKSIFKSPPVIALILNQIGNDCVWVTLAADLPKYMREVLGFSVDKVGLFLSLPCGFMWIVSILSGSLCDYLIDRRYLTIVQARKLFTALSAVTTILLVAASYAACNRTLVIILITLAMGFFGNYIPGMRVNALDLSPNYSGSVLSLVNGAGCISGLIFPTFIGMMIPDSTLEQWRSVFWTIFGIGIVRVTIFSIWASGDVQPWNNSKEFKSAECDKLTDDAVDK